MYVCILDQHGTKLVHKYLPTTPEAFLRVIAPYKEDLVDQLLGEVELYLTRSAKTDDVQTFARLQSMPGIGQILVKEYFAKLEHQHGKAKALTVLTDKLGRAVYYMLTREQASDLQRFVTA